MTVLAGVVVIAVLLVAAIDPQEAGPTGLAVIPIEGLALAAVLLVLPSRPRRAVAVASGAAIGVLAVLKIADLGFVSFLQRPFDLGADWSLASGGYRPDEAFNQLEGYRRLLFFV